MLPQRSLVKFAANGAIYITPTVYQNNENRTNVKAKAIN